MFDYFSGELFARVKLVSIIFVSLWVSTADVIQTMAIFGVLTVWAMKVFSPKRRHKLCILTLCKNSQCSCHIIVTDCLVFLSFQI
jgi:poly(A) polymerase Pap1